MNTNLRGRAADWLTAAFYAAVVAIAGVGCALAAVAWSDWELWAILPAVGVLELAALSLLFRADHRRRLGERAVAYRVLAVAVGSLAIGINWFGHLDGSRIDAAFFAGFSALGLGMALLMSGDRRRDHLRHVGQLPPTTPAYGPWQWARHPWLTRRARALALRTPALGLYGSLEAAAEQKRTEQRHAALKALLVDMIGRRYEDPLVAQVVVTTLDLDDVTRRFAAAADVNAVVAELWARVPIGAAIEPAETDAVEMTSAAHKRPPVKGEIVIADVSDVEPVSAGHRRGAHRLPDRDVDRVVAAMLDAEPTITNRDLARIATRDPRTIATLRKALRKAARSDRSGFGFGSK